MDIASMVLGIISLLISFFCGCVSIVTAPIGLILGIVDLMKNKGEKGKGMAIAGIIMCGIAILISIIGIIYIFFILGESPSTYYNY